MTRKIYRQGPRNVSRYINQNLNTLNVMDVAESSVENVRAFIQAARRLGVHIIEEPRNGCIYLEIRQ